MTIRGFIQSAIRGGWEPAKAHEVFAFNPNNRTGVHYAVRASYTHIEILLDPLVWQAVGKAERWESYSCPVHHTKDQCGIVHRETWKNAMRWMVEALSEGKTLEEYLLSL